MWKNSLRVAVLMGLGILIPACAADVGEACDTRGAQDECVEDAICDTASSTENEPVCLKVCKDDTDCASTDACNGVSGSNIKACKPKTK